jgi:hypothetical protein
MIGRTCNTYRERRCAYRVMVGKPEGRRPLETARRRWEIILKWIFEKYEGGRGMDWIGLAHDTDRWRALVNAVMNLQVPQNAGYFLTR